MDIELLTDACMMYIVSPLAGLGGCTLWQLPAYSLLSLLVWYYKLLYHTLAR